MSGVRAAVIGAAQGLHLSVWAIAFTTALIAVFVGIPATVAYLLGWWSL